LLSLHFIYRIIKFINKLKNSPDLVIRPIDISDPEISNKILEVSLNWERQSGMNENDASYLCKALERALKYSHKNTFSLGVFMRDKLVGYSINEILNNGYALGNFQQADLQSSEALYSLLMQEVAVHLDERGCNHLNLEQDLGIIGLRNWKMSYGPTVLLKKYVVSFK